MNIFQIDVYYSIPFVKKYFPELYAYCFEDEK